MTKKVLNEKNFIRTINNAINILNNLEWDFYEEVGKTIIKIGKNLNYLKDCIQNRHDLKNLLKGNIRNIMILHQKLCLDNVMEDYIHNDNDKLILELISLKYDFREIVLQRQNKNNI